MALVGSHKELMVVAAMLVVATLLSSSLLWLLQVSDSLGCRKFAGDHPGIQKVGRQGEDECFRTSVRRLLVRRQRIQGKLVICTAGNRSFECFAPLDFWEVGFLKDDDDDSLCVVYKNL